VCCLANLAARFALSILMDVGGNLGEEYNKQHSQGEGRHPSADTYGFAPKRHTTSHICPGVPIGRHDPAKVSDTPNPV
jgi:hypothetical protein